jgi:diguanylate cyclase (GGDEF)-like protein
MGSAFAIAATKTARRAVLAALLGASAIVTVFVAERLSFEAQYGDAVENLRLATSLGGNIVYLDEKRSKATSLAIATREARWKAEYREAEPRLRAAMSAVREIAPPDIQKIFDDETVFANKRLSEIQDRVFELIEAGDTAKAEAIVISGVYQQNKAILRRGTQKFIESLGARLEAERATIAYRSKLLMAIVGLASLVIGFGFWRHLRRALARSEAAFMGAEEEIRSLALNDTLTGLANRKHFNTELTRATSRVSRSGLNLAVIIIDLDRFKTINELHGLPVGDRVLREIGARLSAGSRAGEVAARLGADEFAVVCEFGEDVREAQQAAERLMKLVAQPIYLDGPALDVSASVGMALCPRDATSPDELLRKADIALVRAKEAGRGQIRTFNEAMDDVLQERSRVEEELGLAILSGEIIPYYQPLVDMGTESTRGFEVLARWKHPTRGLIAPAVFIPVAEETGLVTDLTFAIMRRAFLDVRDWPASLSIAVNVSAQTLLDPWFAERVLGILAETRFPAARLEIEITENALVYDMLAARRVITSLKNQGVKFSLDDFGAGYSSLGYLSELSFDKIKIDQSFIRSMHESPSSAKIITAIIGLGRSLGLPTVAEGVETERDADALRALGCDMGQGYHFARPQPIETIASTFLPQRRPTAKVIKAA